MAKLNPSTVNTVRLTTVLHKGKFSAAAALIKIGSPNARVDNYKYGGCLLSVNLDGTVSVSYTHLDVYKRQLLLTGLWPVNRPLFWQMNPLVI